MTNFNPAVKFTVRASGMYDTNVKIVNICDLMQVLFPGYYENLLFTRISYEETCKEVLGWCKANNAHYYAAPREDFSKAEACGEAIALGLSAVVVEDLS